MCESIPEEIDKILSEKYAQVDASVHYIFTVVTDCAKNAGKHLVAIIKTDDIEEILYHYKALQEIEETLRTIFSCGPKVSYSLVDQILDCEGEGYQEIRDKLKAAGVE